jgi:peptidyl-tRNA hydrolase
LISDREQSLIQPIVLQQTGSHSESILAVAKASLLGYLKQSVSEEDVWQVWLDDEQGKTVRRAKEQDFEKLLAEQDHAAEVSVGKARALAYAPVRYTEMSKKVRRLQVNGTDFERESGARTSLSGIRPSCPTVVLDAGLGMTTGKSAAQASHALFAWWWTLNNERRQEWLSSGSPLDVVEVSSSEFRALSRSLSSYHLIIHDAGHTEIESGSATAFVLQ